MVWDFVAGYLVTKGYRPVAEKTDKVNFYLKMDGDTINVCTLIKMLKGWSVEREFLEDNMNQMERKFYLSGYRNVNFMHIIFTDDMPTVKEVAGGYLKCWLVDVVANRLVIYENQPENYLDMRTELENELEEEADNLNIKINFSGIPIISIILIIINVVVYFMLETIGNTEDTLFMLKFGASNWKLIFKEGQYYRLFTSMFMHFGPAHLLSNMFMLGIIGSSLEKTIGRLNYLLVYIASGLIASIGSALFYMASNEFTVCAGASGAIYGLIGALIGVIIKNNRKKQKTDHLIGWRMVFLAAILVYGSVTSDGIDFAAHIVGMASGFMMTLIAYNPLYMKFKHYYKRR